MRAGLCVIALLGTSLFAGCRQDPAQILLERDLRLQEDKIHHLRGHITDLNASLEACRRENELARRGGSSEGRPSSSSPDSLPAPGRPTTPGTSTPPRSLLPTLPSPGRTRSQPNQNPSDFNLEVPQVEGIPDLYKGSAVDPAQLEYEYLEEAPVLLPTSNNVIVELDDSRAVESIMLNPRLTGSYNAKGHGIDDGITVLIEPRTAQGEILQAPGDVSIVLIDPKNGGNRFARWDFYSDETVHSLQRNAIGQGIYLRLLWPEHPPTSERLVMFVRYTTLDGRKLEAQREITIRRRAQPQQRSPVNQVVTTAPQILVPQEQSAPIRVVEQPAITPQPTLSNERPIPTKPAWSPYR